MRRVLILGTSGAGKTTLGRELATRLGVPFIETDALNHGPGWVEAEDEVLRARMLAAMGAGGWVVDNDYRRKLGNLVVDRADTVVWLDLPLVLTQARLLRRTLASLADGRELWNGNRQTWSAAFVGRESLFAWAVRSHFSARRSVPERIATAVGRPCLVRLRSPAAVERFLAGVPSRSAIVRP